MAPPSIEDYKVRLDNEIRSSIETVKAAPSLSHIAKSKRYVNQSYFKQVQEVPFVEAVNNNPVYQTVGKHQRSRRKINPLTSPGKSSGEFARNKNAASSTSLISAAEFGQHGEHLKGLNSSIDRLKDELRIKDRLISKLLENDDDEEELAKVGSTAQLSNDTNSIK